jgi:hypothetical protein
MPQKGRLLHLPHPRRAVRLSDVDRVSHRGLAPKPRRAPSRLRRSERKAESYRI